MIVTLWSVCDVQTLNKSRIVLKTLEPLLLNLSLCLTANRTAAFIVSSSIYGQLLVVVCIAFFVAQLVTPKIPLYYFEVSSSSIFLSILRKSHLPPMRFES